MIAKDSISYPCLAVAVHFSVPYVAVLKAGGELLRCYTEGFAVTDASILHFGPPTAREQLLDNYARAAKQFKWGPFSEH